MTTSRICLVIAVMMLGQPAHAAVILFNTDPFAGTTALTTPGRDIVGAPGTPLTFNIAVDQFVFDAVFGVNEVLFQNSLSSNLPATGYNVVVLQDGPPLAAGIAADRIAAQLTTPGPGFFIYFNTGLDLPRLVFSTDLSVPTADLAILARLTNLSGPAGFATLPSFTSANFAAVPEPATLSLLGLGLALGARKWRQRRNA